MRICLFFGSLSTRGGAERIITHLANTWVTTNSVIILTLDNNTPGYQLREGVDLIQLGVAGQSESVIQRIIRSIKTIRLIHGVIRSQKPDVIMAFNMKPMILALLARGTNTTCKIVASERANPQFSHSGKLESIIQDYALRRVDGFIFQTEGVQKLFPQCVTEKSVVIPNGVFPSVLPEVIPYYKRDLTKICAVGRLVWQKGYDITIRAFHKFCDTHAGYTLHIFGTGELKAELLELTDELGISDLVFFHGNVASVLEEIKRAGMYILSSRFEGMPNALMEAMACGLPCISSDCDFGPGELIENLVNGILVPIEDPEALSSAMAELADNHELAKSLGSHAEHIRVTHSGSLIAEKYYRFLFDTVTRETERR